MNTLLFALIYIAALCLPGLALHRLILREFTNPALFSMAVSFAWYCFCFVTAKLLGLSASALGLALVISIFVAGLFLVFSDNTNTKRGNPSGDGLALVGIIVASLAFQLLAGPYLEVPADVFTHLERYQVALKQIENNALGRDLSLLQLFKQGSGVYYYLAPLITHKLNIPLIEIISALDFVHRTLFLCVIYAFTKQVFAHQKKAHYVAIAAAMLVAIHMGINVFAFVRYYTLAPAMLNLSLYFAMVASFLFVVQKKEWLSSLKGYVLIIFLLAMASAVHVQEAMFAAVIIACISLILFSSQLLSLRQYSALKVSRYHLPVLTILMLAGFATLYVYSWLNLDRAPNADWRLWEFGQLADFLPAISTLNLKFQFARTITLWGLIVCALFLLNIRRYKNNWFILAGMLSPFLTILNPFFVDLFLRQDDSTTLWRLCYLIPIHFVAADLLLLYAQRFWHSVGGARLASALALIVLTLPLLPVGNTWQGLHYSRAPTLIPQQSSNSLEQYSDLLEFLVGLDTTYSVLTDPVTGYLVSGATKHKNQRRKFFRTSSFRDFTFEDYTSLPLAKYAGYLLIVNQRDMPNSKVGGLARHWEEQPWQHRRHYYTPTLLAHLNDNPERFDKLWSGKQVSVYKITR